MKGKTPRASRLGAILTVVALAALSALLPDRYKAAHVSIPYVAATAMVVPMLVVSVMREPGRFLRVERSLTLAGASTIGILTTLNLGGIIYKLVFNAAELKPAPLFGSSLMIWTTNALMFTMLYWLLDAGGPDARARGEAHYPDFAFPQLEDPSKAPPGWAASYLDYLFLGFTTSTAFSPTEDMPLTPRAKVLMMIQSGVSLATIAIVAARTVNILR